MSVIAVKFSESRQAKEQAEIRRIIRKTGRDLLSKSERDVLITIVNLWFYHKGGPEGYIHPGCEKIAKRSKVSVVTVKRTLSLLREHGIVVALAYANGGRKATRYTVDLTALRNVLNPHGVKTLEGKLIAFPAQTVQNDTVSEHVNDTVYPYQNDTRYYRAFHTPFAKVADTTQSFALAVKPEDLSQSEFSQGLSQILAQGLGGIPNA